MAPIQFFHGTSHKALVRGAARLAKVEVISLNEDGAELVAYTPEAQHLYFTLYDQLYDRHFGPHVRNELVK